MDVSSDSKSAMPQVLSMAIDSNDAYESEIRIRLGDQVKYILVDPGIYGADILSFPPDLFNHLPNLPPGDWTQAHISRGPDGIRIDFTSLKLRGVQVPWHQNMVDVLSLVSVKKYSHRVTEVQYGSRTAIAKIARFEYEMGLLENETRLYQIINDHKIGPAFLGHLTEHGRIMGFLVEKMEGRCANIDDMPACQHIVKKLHDIGIVHGDLNKYNFIISQSNVRLVDFENGKMSGDQSVMAKEMDSLDEELREETGRGGPGYISDS